MSLPKHVKLDRCIPDPHKRPNHIFHAKSEETFHVDEDTFLEVAARVRQETPEVQDVEEETVAEETGLTLAEDTDSAAQSQAQEKEEDKPTHSLEELREMAASLELTVSDDASVDELLAAVTAAVSGQTGDAHAA